MGFEVSCGWTSVSLPPEWGTRVEQFAADRTRDANPEHREKYRQNYHRRVGAWVLFCLSLRRSPVSDDPELRELWLSTAHTITGTPRNLGNGAQRFHRESILDWLAWSATS